MQDKHQNDDVLLDGDTSEIAVGKRGHDIVTKTPVLCLKVPRDDYISIYNDVHKLHMQKKTSALRLMPIFKLCTDEEIKDPCKIRHHTALQG